ncbi:MAG: restriction endonuclease subunit S [Oscillospiraceae bacterium]
MKWEKVKLGDIIKIKKGEYITKKESKQGIYPVILGGKEPAYYIDKYNHTGKAIVVSRSGASAGYVSYWNEPIFVTDGFIIEPLDSIEHDFLYYLMKNHQPQLQGLQGGSAIPHVNPRIINAIECVLPPIDTQKRIVSILSAYDKLIENNQKQIKLLEEMAQRLYKEWFVDLRFPDWENTEIVNGVPVGWREGTLTEIASFKRGKTITKANVKEGTVPVVAGGLEPAYYHNEANTTAPVITVSGSGANAGFSRLYHEDVFASDCSFVDSDSTPYLFFVYCFLKDNKFQIDSLQKGSAQPHVYAKDINAMKIVLAPEAILHSFCSITKNYYTMIGKLKKQIKKLSEARDRLLPKLMSGELEV